MEFERINPMSNQLASTAQAMTPEEAGGSRGSCRAWLPSMVRDGGLRYAVLRSLTQHWPWSPERTSS